MIIFAFIFIFAFGLYVYALTNRDKNLDYKVTPQYQKLGNEGKLKADIIEGLKININKDILNNDPFSRIAKRKEIEDFIDMRESTFYMHIESLSKQHKISHDLAFDTIFSTCNYIRVQYGIQPQKATFSK